MLPLLHLLLTSRTLLFSTCGLAASQNFISYNVFSSKTRGIVASDNVVVYECMYMAEHNACSVIILFCYQHASDCCTLTLVLLYSGCSGISVL